MPCRTTRRIGCTVTLAAAVSLGGCMLETGSTDGDGGDSGNASDGTLSDGRTADDATGEGAAGDDGAANDVAAKGDEAGEDSGTNDAAKTTDAAADADAADADAGDAADAADTGAGDATETSAGDAGVTDADAGGVASDGGAADGAVDCTAVPPKLSLSPTSLTLTSPCQGMRSAPTVFISLTNSGSDPVTWTASAGPTIRLTNAGSTIPGNGQDSLEVDLVAPSVYPLPGGTISDSIRIAEVSPAGCTHVVPVTEGFEGYWYSPTDLEFGDVQVGHSVSKHVTVTYQDNGYFSGSLFVSGNTSGDFTWGGQIGGAGSPLGGFDVIFAPTVTGSDQATFVWGGFNVSTCSPPVTATGTGTP
jgi:hypothetical protein